MSSMWVLRKLARKWLGNRPGGKKSSRRTQRPRSVRPSLEHLECRLAPATDIWTGGGTNFNWSNPANWNNGVPAAGDDLSFPDTFGMQIVPASSKLNSFNDLSAGTVYNSITFSGTGYNLHGNSIVLNSTASTGVLIGNNPAGSNDTITFNIQLGAATGNLQFFTVNTPGAGLTVSGSLSSPAGQPGATLTKDGDGILFFTADNSTFSGPITVQAGVLQIQNAKALGTNTTTVLFDTAAPQHSGQLQLSGGIGPVANRLILNGTGPDGTGALFNVSGTNTVSGNIEMDSDTAIGAFASSTNNNGVLTVNATTLVLNGIISDTGSGHNLSKEGLGQVVLDPLGGPNKGPDGNLDFGNLYRGNTTVDNGTLTIRHSMALGQGPGNGAAATAVVNSTPAQSGTLQVEFLPASPTRNWVDPNVNAAKDGFNVPNELLILNGPGFEGIHVYPRAPGAAGAPIITTTGALNNKAGNNSWAQGITLWSGPGALAFDPIFWGDSPRVPAVGLGPTVGIGAEANTTLTLNGPISDNTGGNRTYSLIKTRPGRVALTDSNTFLGKTEVLDGAINIRDSQALGQATSQDQVFVFPGASLELQADAKTDSLTGTTDLRVGNIDVTLVGHGINNEGALLNIAGRNQWNGKIHLQTYLQRANPTITFTSDGAAIGVNADPGPFDANANPLTPLGFSQLTVNGLIDDGVFSQNLFPTAELFKVGAAGPVQPNGTRDSGGELVLTNANSYLGVTDIQTGWITARNGQALGGTIASLRDIEQTPYLPAATINNANRYGITALSDTLQPGTIVENGASLVLKTDLSGNDLSVFENLFLSGDGITHRLGQPDANGNQNFSWLNQKGALLNLEGQNTVGGVDTDPTSPVFRTDAGDIALNGQAGIGAELDGFVSSNPPASQLTLMGTTTEVTPGWVDKGMAPIPGSGIDKLGSQRLIMQGPGTYTGNVDVKAGVLRVQNDTALGVGVTAKTTVENGSALELKGSVPVENGGLGSGIQVATEGLILNGQGNTTAPDDVAGSTSIPALENLSADNLWRGPVTFASDTTIGVESGSRLTVYGAIGDTSVNGAGFTKVGIDTPTTKVGTGKLVLAGANSYRGMTDIMAGTVNLQNGSALGAPSTATVQTVTVSGTAGSFTLTFNGQTTDPVAHPLPFNATAQQVADALNALSTVTGAGGVVSVTQSGNAYTVTFGGNLTGFNVPTMTATGSGMPNPTVATTTPGNGGVLTSATAGIELQGNITVAGKSLQTLATGSPSASDLTNVATWFPQGPAPVVNGQTSGNQNVAGRITGVSVDPTNTNVIYVATAGGGSWKTTDGGQTWQPLNDKSLSTGEVTPPSGGSQTLPGIVHWWRAEGDATDSQGNDNGVLTGFGGFGDVGFTNGENGEGFQFFGDDSFVQFGPEDFGTADFSLGFYISTTQKNYQTILGTRETATANGNDNFFGVRMTANGNVEVTLDQDTSGTNFLQVTSNKKINDGAFHLVTITRSTTGGSSTVSIYIDGALDNTGALAVPTGPTNLQNGNTLNVGWEPADSSGGNVVSSFDGVMDEIQVYNRALSAADVQTLAKANANATPIASQSEFGGTLVVAPSDPHVVYYATGESNNGPDSFYGQGIYMSRDAGRTWTLLQGNQGVNEFAGMVISKIVVDPRNPFTVYAAINNGGVNGTAAGNNGIWFSQNTSVAQPVWLNLSQYDSQVRETHNPPLPPGPDDDLTLNFSSAEQYTDLKVVVDQAPDAAGDARFLIMAIGTPDGGTGTNAVYVAHLNIVTPDSFNPAFPSFRAVDWVPTGWDRFAFRVTDGITDTLFNNPQLPFGGGSGTSVNVTVPSNGVIRTAVSPDFSGSQFTLYAATTYPTTYSDVGGFLSNPGLEALKGTFRDMMRANMTWSPTTGLWSSPGWGATTTQPGADYQGPQFAGNGQNDSTLIANPTNPNQVFAAGVGQPFTSGPWMTTDGGTTWTDIGVGADGNGPHANAHGMTFDNLGRLLLSTDGGLWRLDNSTPGSIHWTDLNGNLANLQFNSVATDPNDPFHAWGGTEDNGLVVYNGDSGNFAWTQTDGNNGGPVVVDINNPQNVYHIQDGVLRKSTDGGQTWTTVFTVENVPAPGLAVGPTPPGPQPTYFPFKYYYPTFESYQFNTEQPWNDNYSSPTAPQNLVTNNIQVPLVIDTVNTNRLVIAGPPAGTPNPTRHFGSQPWESIQAGQTGTFVSLDPNNQIQGGLLGLALAVDQGPFQADPRFPLITDQGSNTYTPDTIYALTNNAVWVTKDHGRHWIKSNGAGTTGLAATSLAGIAVDPNNRDVAYVIRNSATGGGAHVYKTTDAGQHWTAIDGTGGGSLPDLPAWAVTINPKTGELFVGNDNGVWALPSGSTTWQRFGVGMPNTQVKSLVLDPNLDRLTAGTYGRSMFELFLDDSRPNGGAIRAVSGSAVWTGPVTFITNPNPGPTALTGNTIIRAEKDASVNFVGPISNDNAGDTWSLTKVGAGTVILSGNNSYGGAGSTVVVNGVAVPGDTDVKEGILVVHNPMALGSTQSGTIVESGAALELQSDVIGEPLQLNGDGTTFNGHNTGSLRNVSNNNTYSGPITLDTNTTIGVDSGSTLTVTGGIGDGGAGHSLTKELTGTLILQAADTYTGLTTVEQGVLNIQNDNALVSPLSPAVIVKDGAALQLQGGVTVGNEALALSGTGISGTGALLSTGGSNTWSGPITFEALPAFSPESSPVGTVALGATDPTATLVIATDIQEQEPTGLSKVGPGTVVLSTANGYSGGTYVNAGILRIQDPNALGTRNTLEVQRVTVGGDRLGSFTLNLGGQITGAIPFGSSAATVKTALEKLSNVGTNNTQVALNSAVLPDGNTVFVYTVTFVGSLAGFNEPQMIATGLNGTTAVASTVSDGGIGTQVNAGGTLQLDLAGAASQTVTGEVLDLNGVGAPRPAPIQAGNVQDTNFGALDNVSGDNTWAANIILDTTTPGLNPPQTDAIGVDGGTLSTGADVLDPTPTPFSPATFEKVGPGALFFPTVNDYQGNTQIIDGVLDVAAGTNAANKSALGAVTSSESETVTILGGTGSFTLTFRGQTTSSLAFNATAAQVQAALTALSTIGGAGGTVSVTQNGNVYTITFGGSLAGQNLDPAGGTALTASASGGAAASVLTTVQGGFGGTTVSGAGTLLMDGDITISGEPLVLSGNGFFNGTTNLGALASAGGTDNTWDDSITLNGPASVGAEPLGNLTIDQPISESVTGSSLTKFDFGTVKLTGNANDTYTGTTFVDDGLLDLNKTGGAIAIAGNVVVGDGTAGQAQPDELRLESSGQITAAATMTVNSDGLFDLNDQAQTLAGLTILDGTVNTGGGTHGAQNGQLTLLGTLNMTGGTVSLGTPGAMLILGGTGSTPDVIATSDNTGDAAIIGTGTVFLGAANRQFQVNHGTAPIDLQVAAPIGGSAGLTKTGNGVLELTGVSTFSGATTVTAGELFVDGTGKIGAASLNGGLLGGTGTVGPVTATAAGGILAPGTAGNNLGSTNPGILNVAGDVTLNGASALQVALNGPTPGNTQGSYSQLDVQGNVNLNGAAVAGSIPVASFVPAINQAFTVIQVFGAGHTLTGTFATPTEFLSGLKFSNSFTGTTAVLTRIKANAVTTVGSGGVQYIPGATPALAHVMFTATVSPEPGATFPATTVAGDKVDFFDTRSGSQVLLGQGTVDSNGVATLNLPVSGPNSLDTLGGIGLHTVVAHFEGDANFNSSDSSPTNFGGLTVQGVAANSSPAGQAVLSANGGLTSVVITFAQPVGSFPLAQVTLTDPSGNAISLAGASLTDDATNEVWTLSGFAAQKTPGVYTVTVGPNVTDGSGFPLDQNVNGLYGENGLAPTGDQFAGHVVVDGLAVTGIAPVGPVIDGTGLSTITVTFNIAVGSFPAGAVTLTGPGGAITLSGNPTDTNPGTDTVWQLSFPKQQALGTYTLTVGPNVLDRAGDRMNQNFTSGNTVFGQPGVAPTGDAFQGSIIVSGLKVTGLTPATPVLDGPGLTTATFTFNEAVSTTKTAGGFQAFGPESLTLTDPNGNVIQLIDASGKLAAGVTLTPNAAGTQWTVTFPAQHTLGDYFLTVGPNVTDAVGNLMDQNQNGIGDENPADAFKGGLVVDGLAVTGVGPTTPVLNGPGLSSATITFNEPVDASNNAVGFKGFGPNSLSLTDPTGKVTKLIDASGNLAAGVTLTPDATNTVWTVTFPTQHTPGAYTLTVGPNVFDRAGFEMNQNYTTGNTTPGQAGVAPTGDQFAGTLNVVGLEVTGLGAPTTVLDGNGLVMATINFNEPVQTFPLSDVTLKGPSGNTIALTGATLNPTDASDTSWVLSFPGQKQTALGNYTLTVGPNVTDKNGFALDQNQNGKAGEAADTFNGTLTVAGLQVVGVSPTGTVTSAQGISSFTVTFNEPLAAGALNGQVQVTGPNGAIGGVSITDVTGGRNVFQISFPTQTDLGTYTLTILPGVKDAAGNRLDQNGNHIGGEGGDQFTAQATVIATPFVGIITPQQAAILYGPITPVFRRVHGHMVRVHGRFTQTVTLFNTGQGPIQGPFFLMLAGLPMKRVHRRLVSTVHVLNAAGFGSVLLPGVPFVTDVFSAQQLGSFQGAQFVVNFSTSGPTPVYTPLILAGLVP